MMNLLIVDDEPIIADGLYELFTEERPDRLHVHRVYSTEAAVRYAQTMKLDIVITDVLMPGMNGLALQKRIRSRWPKSEFIFITGHDDFNYIREAMDNGSTAFILKTEDDHVILDAVDKAIAKLEQAFELDVLLENARTQLREMLPLMRNQLFEQWLAGDKGTPEEMSEQMRSLEFELRPDQDVQPVLFRMDPAVDNRLAFPSMQLLYVLQRAISNLLPNVRCMCFRLGEEHIAAVFQGDIDFESLTIGALEQLQEVYAQATGLSVSIAASQSAVPWHQIDLILRRLRAALMQSIGISVLLIYDPSDRDAMAQPEEAMARLAHRILMLSQLLNRRQREAFFAGLQLLLDTLGQQQHNRTILRTEAVLRLFSMASETLSQLHSPGQIDLLSYLARLDVRMIAGGWTDVQMQVTEVFERIFEQIELEQDMRSMDLIQKLHGYIETHLCEDLSLAKLGEVVNYSSTYLSTLYKSLTGGSLVDYVGDLRIQRAKTLLRDERIRIRRVAVESGFESQQYFNRYFKKKTGMTPNDYRNQALGQQNP